MLGPLVAFALAAAPATPQSGVTNGDDRTAVRKVTNFAFKPGKGFELATADGRYSLAIRARLQIRYDFEHPNALYVPDTHVLQIRRARLQFAGNVFGEHNRYYIQFGFSPRDMTGGLVADEGSIRRNPVRDARLEFTYLRKARRRNPGDALDEDGLPVPVALPRDGLGILAQAGYLLPRIDLEVVGRYSVARNVFGARSALRDRDEVGGGINYYFVGHNLKLQFDYSRVWETAPGTSAIAAARRGVDRLRLQIQLAF